MCKLSEIWANQNYRHLKLRCVKCAGDKPMPPKKKKDLVMSDVSSVVEIILQITRDVRSTKTYQRKHTHLSI
jgi:hypothetical protein